MAVAYVLINCNIGEEDSIVEQLQATEGVKDIQRTFGAYDIVIKIELPNADKLRDIIAKVRKMKNIRTTLTMMGIDGQN